MRRIFSIIFFTISSLATATNYYVSNSTGNDSSNGLSESTAWKTIAKVNATAFLPGDVIHFRCGDVWRETLNVSSSGNAASYITYTFYGVGAKPRILGSEAVSGWTNVSGSIWRSPASYSNPYVGSTGDIYFVANNSSAVTFGNLKTYSSDFSNLSAEYDWTWNANTIYVYSVTDPGIRYKSIEAGQRESCIYLNGRQYIEINGIDMFYSEQQGVMEKEPDGGLSGYILRNCEIAYLGSVNGYGYGSRVIYSNSLFENNVIHDCGRRGISLYNYSNQKLSNIVIQNNTFYNGNHTTGIDIGAGTSGGSGSTDSIIIRNNLIYDDPGSRAYSHQIFVQNIPSSGTTVTGIYIYDNIFKYPPAASILLEGITESYIYNNTFYGHNSVTTRGSFHIWVDVGSANVNIMNNIFYSDLTSQTSGSGLEIYCLVSPLVVHSDYNLYYRVSDNLRVVQIAGIVYTRTILSWTALKLATGWETHSPVPADPMFVSSTDYHLKPGSPAIAAGIAVPFLQKDFEGSPESNPPDLGCFSTNSGIAAVPVYLSSVIGNSTPSILEMTYSLSLANIVPSTTAFTVQVNSTGRNVSVVSIAGPKVRLTLAAPVVFGDIVKVSYTEPSLNPLQTPSGGEAASTGLMPVTNNVIEIIEVPEYVSSVVENDAPYVIIVNYNLPLADKTTSTSSFKVTANDIIEMTIMSVSVEGNQLKIKLTDEVNPKDKITLSYIKPASNPVQTTKGGEAASYSNKLVTNNVQEDNDPNGADSVLFNENVNIFPNPADRYFNISIAETYHSSLVIRVINTSGAILYEESIQPGTALLQVPANVASGVYFIQFLSGSSSLGTKKLIVRHNKL